jgi:predicted nucleic acid-binding protein
MRTASRCCIDSCVWVKYAGNYKATTLLNLIVTQNLIVYADNYLLGEVYSALISSFGFEKREADRAIQIISSLIIVKAPRSIYRLSADPKDNYLYDLCIQNNCKFLITIDKKILIDKHAPFEMKTDAWLKRRV